MVSNSPRSCSAKGSIRGAGLPGARAKVCVFCEVLEKQANDNPCEKCGGKATRDCFNAEQWQVTLGVKEAQNVRPRPISISPWKLSTYVQQSCFRRSLLLNNVSFSAMEEMPHAGHMFLVIEPPRKNLTINPKS